MKKGTGLNRLILLSIFGILTLTSGLAQEDLEVITGKWLRYGNARNSLYDHLSGIAYSQLAAREEIISGIKSPEQWQQRQDLIRGKLHECIGTFPEKTPLNAKTMKIITKEGFRVEHVVFESVPGFYVTASLYLPGKVIKKTKAPAIIYCSGHSADGYRSDVYQHVILNLVKKGFIVFAFDPVGQGERLEYFDPQKGKSVVGGPTSEHSYPGAQAFLTGSSQAMYMIWDGIRSVDYLLSRKEVDPSRIGITGRSGGGTQSAFIAAFDDRIYAAAPENYITNYRRLLETIGPQDAEQNLFNIISRGLDHPDFLMVRAPRPALMITTSNDMFSIQGAMETGKQVSQIYQVYGKPENFSRCEDDAPHASTRKNREVMYAFFQKHLGNPGNPADEDVVPLTKEELKVTETGQVSTSLKGETVYSLNLKKALQLETGLKDLSPERMIMSARKLSGYLEPVTSDAPVFTGRILRTGYSIEKYFIKGEGDYMIPYLLFRPQAASGKSMIYLHPQGKSAEAKSGGEIESFVKQGFIVLAPDIAGTGENGPGDLKGDAYFAGASHNLWYAAMLGGRSIAGVQAGDVVRLARMLKKNGYDEVTGFARKGLCTVLLHAATFSGEINSLVLVEPYSSFMAIVSERFYDPFMILSSVPAALVGYDLPYLEAAFAPRRLVITGATDGKGSNTAQDRIDRDLSIVKASYKNSNSEDKLKIIPSGKPDYVSLSVWLSN